MARIGRIVWETIGCDIKIILKAAYSHLQGSINVFQQLEQYESLERQKRTNSTTCGEDMFRNQAYVENDGFEKSEGM